MIDKASVKTLAFFLLGRIPCGPQSHSPGDGRFTPGRRGRSLPGFAELVRVLIT